MRTGAGSRRMDPCQPSASSSSLPTTDQTLDLAGPVEVFDVAEPHGITPPYRIEVVGPDRRPVVTIERDHHHARPPRSPTSAARSTPSWSPAAIGVASHDREPGARRRGAPHRGRVPPGRVGLHRRVRARRGRAARRPPRHHALGRRAAGSPRATRGSRSSPTRSSCATATSTPRPASPPASTSASRWSRRTTAATVALAVARQLVVFLKRPGGQAQFSSHLSTQTADRDDARRGPGLDRRPPRRRPLGRGARRAAPR